MRGGDKRMQMGGVEKIGEGVREWEKGGNGKVGRECS